MNWLLVGGFFAVSTVTFWLANTAAAWWLVNVAGRMPGLLRPLVGFFGWFPWALLLVVMFFGWFEFFANYLEDLPDQTAKYIVLAPGVLWALSFGLAYLPVSRRYRKKLQDKGFLDR